MSAGTKNAAPAGAPAAQRPAAADARERGKKAHSVKLQSFIPGHMDEALAREAARSNTTKSALGRRAVECYLARPGSGRALTPGPRVRGAGATKVWAWLEPEECQYVDAHAARERVSRSAAVGALIRTARARTDRSVPAGEAAQLLEKISLIEARTEALGRALGGVQLLLVHWAAKSGTMDVPEDELLAEVRRAGDEYWDAIEDILGRGGVR